MWKKKKFLTMEEQVAKLSSKCRELTEEECRMLNGGGSNDYGGYNNWSEYAYAMSHEAAGDANKTWMPEKKETSSSNTDSTSSSQKNTGNGTNGNQSSLSETTITPTEDGNTESTIGATSSTNTGSQSSTTPKTPGYYSNTCTAAMLAEYKGRRISISEDLKNTENDEINTKVFATMDEAAIDFARTYNDDSIKKNKELGSSIYLNENNEFFYTVPSKGGIDSVIPSKITGIKRVAIIHTHTEGFQMDNMSFTDMNNAYSENIYSYMVNSSGGIMKYNPIKEYDISSNPSELTQITDIPNINNFMDYPDNRTLNNVFSKLYYYFTGK